MCYICLSKRVCYHGDFQQRQEQPQGVFVTITTFIPACRSQESQTGTPTQWGETSVYLNDSSWAGVGLKPLYGEIINDTIPQWALESVQINRPQSHKNTTQITTKVIYCSELVWNIHIKSANGKSHSPVAVISFLKLKLTKPNPFSCV